MSGVVFERLAIIGSGLIGGSVALAARERGAAHQIRVVDRSELPGCEFDQLPLAEAAAWADGIVVAVPVCAVDAVFCELSKHVSDTALVTDTVSVKRPVADAARRWLQRPEKCVGAHPMAGGERSGFEHADSTLFVDAPCLLALAGCELEDDVQRVEAFWRALGARTTRHTPDEHDGIVAVLSHAPHLVAFAFARGLADMDALELAGSGLRDFLRIARANPDLWCEILWANRERVAAEAERFRANFDVLVGALHRADRPRLLEAIEAGCGAAERL